MANPLHLGALALIPVLMFALADPVSADGPLVLKTDAKSNSKMLFWLESSLKRVYPTSKPGRNQTITISSARNSKVSFQACVRNQRSLPLTIECGTTNGVEGGYVQIRRVGYVPMRFCTTGVPCAEIDGADHVPGLVPDPLFNDRKADVGPYENVSFWVTLTIPTEAKPGPRKMIIQYSFGTEPSQKAELSATIDVKPFTIQKMHDFPVIHWWRGECIWDYYKTGMAEDERWWTLTRKYIDDMIEHGTNSIYVPVFFFRRETFERPCQLLKVTEPEPGKYEFDWTDVKRFVKLARDAGTEHYEWSAFWIYWGAKNPLRVYKWADGKAVMLWPPDADGHGPMFHNFLKQFLPEFHKFLLSEGILEQSFFHISDEPGEGESLDNYKKARDFLAENAPWMKGKVIDALSSIEYGRQHLTDIPIPIINTAKSYIDEKIPHWVYFCCEPRGSYLQRLLDTPLPKVRMSGWLFYRLGAKGFLHWGYNYWHVLEQEKLIDPFSDATAACWPMIPPGDPFMVYPGVDGPIDSIRWEIFAESLQDYAMLQTAGIKPDDPMLAGIKDYADFPKSEEWINQALKNILDSK
ncbi:DUF4091 domain-containing protein [uncultured Desulfobulbus sp.]|uniref:DUF4091 domain-containing protein n=1 Tax=uncultured Desulfobulbus sp. TaxID=239745 RepID=UPI0029C78479|nr:DUF4091 domain-containing protein [uncultured Desulfobulbus sp.]